jgi:serine phosphatase RsbU (regulator of sigma subunit)
MLIATSDGIAEAESPSGAKFGDWGILQVIRNRRDRGVHDLAGELMTAVRSFTGQRTDITSTDRTVVLAHFADNADSKPRSIDLRCHPQFGVAATAA